MVVARTQIVLWGPMVTPATVSVAPTIVTMAVVPPMVRLTRMAILAFLILVMPAAIMITVGQAHWARINVTGPFSIR